MQTLGEYHELKSTLLEKEEYIISGFQDDTSEEEAFKILKWFTTHEVFTSPIQTISCSPDIPKEKIVRLIYHDK